MSNKTEMSPEASHYHELLIQVKDMLSHHLAPERDIGDAFEDAHDLVQWIEGAFEEHKRVPCTMCKTAPPHICKMGCTKKTYP